MRVSDLDHKTVVIWGTGKEGIAAAHLIHSILPHLHLSFIDENDGSEEINGIPVIHTPELISEKISSADIVIKSPGVSFYHPLLEREKRRGIVVTSLLNLWSTNIDRPALIGVTGTKGKSTTSALLHHVLTSLGKKSALLGNIGTPVSECDETDADYLVIEVSSYQAADFSGLFDIAVLTSLYPEHLDWHGSVPIYYRDKANLLLHSKERLIDGKAAETLKDNALCPENETIFNTPDALHFEGHNLFDGKTLIGELSNSYLLRPHNQGNVCAVLSVIKTLGLDMVASLDAMQSFRGLPHRQFDLGEKDGVLYVDDSISTTPQSSIAAMEVYAGRPITVILGGFDRGIEYEPLVTYIAEKNLNASICMGPSGKRIFDLLTTRHVPNIFFCDGIQSAVEKAKGVTPQSGVVLLSPAAPSYGMFKNYIERAEAFRRACGFSD